MTKAKTIMSYLVGFLSIAGVAFTIAFLIRGGANPGFEQYPAITNLHVVPGLLYLALAPLQFSKTIRARYPVYHRWSGRLLVAVGLALGLAALFLGIVIPFSGLTEQIVTGAFGIFFLISIVKGFQCARARQFARHREWMIRAFAIGLSIVTMRLIFIPILIAIGNPTDADAVLYSIVSFTIAFVLHSTVAELWIRVTRTKHTVLESAAPTTG